MPYRTYNVTPGQSSSDYQSNPYRQAPPSQATSYGQPTPYSQSTSYSRPSAYTQSSSRAQPSFQAYHNSSAQPSSTVRYVSSTQPTRSALPSQPENPRRSIYRRRDSDNEPLMIRRQRRIDEIADVLPVRTTRTYPQAAQNIYRQDLALDQTASRRQYDGLFHCGCGYSTSKQHKIISHTTGAHNAATPYVCPVCGVRCPRGLYQYNAHLQEYHPELVQHTALQYRDDRFIRRNGYYYS